jgi:hypothetical protein
MNQELILFHLREAKEELGQTIDQIAADSSYDYGEFLVAMSHLYHHLNTAWNGRDASPERHYAHDKVDFHAWRKFPDIDEMLLD